MSEFIPVNELDKAIRVAPAIAGASSYDGRTMSPELRQFIEEARFYKAAVLRVAEMLPADDASLDELIGETIEASVQKEFLFVLLAALGTGRKVAARHLAAGTIMMPNWAVLGWAAWHMAGDVPEPLMAALQQYQLSREMEATAFFVVGSWCKEHRGGTLPNGLLSAARAEARHPTSEPYEANRMAMLRSLAYLTGDKSLAAIIQQHKGPPNEAGVKQYCEKLLGVFKANTMSSFLPDAPVNTLANGTTMRRAVARIGRNEPCPCGSRKKYKHCCQTKDQERLYHSSEVAGRTQEEVDANREMHLTLARLEKTQPSEMARLDPLKIPKDLLVPYLMRLGAFGLFDRAAEAFERLGYADELREVWRFVVFFATRKEKKDVVERLVKWHQGTADIEDKLPPGARLLLAQDDPARFLGLLEALSLDALQTEDSESLQKYAYGVLESPKLRALGIIVSRSMLPLVEKREASFLFGQILETRDKLNLSPDDPAGDMIDRLFDDDAADESKDAAALRQAQRSLDTKAAEVRQLKESLEQMQREIARREKPPTSDPASAAPSVPVDERALKELRQKVDSLKSALKERHHERNGLRRELQKAHTDLEALRQNTARATPDEPEDNEETLLLPQDVPEVHPVRVIEFPKTFQQTLAGFPRHVARAAIIMSGRLAAGEPAAFVGALRLKATPDVWRQRIGSDFRLLFRLWPDYLQVVDLVNRKDLERRIKALV